MKMTLPENVKRILEVLRENGYEGYAVGGCVRDCVLGRKPQDWDITTSALPEQVKALFRHTVDTGIRHGTVTVLLNGEGYEVTTYRIDGEYEDARHPKTVAFTGSLIEDLKRRDFTINAMAYNETDGLVDVFEGQADLARGEIRCVGNPVERFGEDALRMLRAVRFAAQLDFTIEEKTKQAIRELAPNIGKVSAERIQAELVKLLTSDHPQMLRVAYETGLTAVFLPEFDRMMETPQNNPHHCYSVGEHTLAALTYAPGDKVIRLTMLLHDVAKPDCRTTDAEGIDHFKGHQQKGSEMARAILRRLKFDNDTTDAVCRLILWHDDKPELEEKAVRRAIHRVGEGQYPALFDVKRADMLAQSDYERVKKEQWLAGYQALYQKITEEKQCLCIRDLAVNGSDLIAEGMKPGKEIGEMLKRLLELTLDDPAQNTRQNLLEQVHKLQSSHIG